MRFGVPRSPSPSPVRRKYRSKSKFGLTSDSDGDLHSDSESESSYSDSSSDDSAASSASSDSFCYASDADVPEHTPRPRKSLRNAIEIQDIQETVVAIRLRTRHHDVYEDWERQTRLDSFRTARKELNTSQTQFEDEQQRLRKTEEEQRAAAHASKMKDVQVRLDQMRLKFKAEEDRVRENYKIREKRISDQIESVIRLEQEKEKARLEVERRVLEETERKRREEEERRRMEEERKKAEEEKRKAEVERKRKEEEEERRKEEEEKRKKLEEERELLKEEQLRIKKEEGEKEQRQALGLTTAREDWILARTYLKALKETMKAVKADKNTKSEWSKGRRQFTAKIGQITDNDAEINRISTQLYQIIHPSGITYPPALSRALLSSLSKAILLQAETEVTAEKKSAKPLARVAFNLLDTIDGFSDVFFAKLVQRVGGWPIPIIVPPRDADGKPWENEMARNKAMGYRYKPYENGNGGAEVESGSDYAMRVYGIMRVYFQILKITPQQKPMKPFFQLPRYWTWVTRMLGQRELLGSAVAAQVIYIALEVLGSEARKLWGRQWDKGLALIYEGVTVGFSGKGGNGNNLIGGSTPEGIAARVRVQLEVEKIMRGS